jgi:hypothetical protein
LPYFNGLALEGIFCSFAIVLRMGRKMPRRTVKLNNEVTLCKEAGKT